MTRIQKNFRLNHLTIAALEELSKQLGMSQAQIIETIVPALLLDLTDAEHDHLRPVAMAMSLRRAAAKD